MLVEMFNNKSRGHPLERSIENPSVPLSAIGDDFFDFSGGSNSSGVRVNTATALGDSALWKGVNLLSDWVGKIPINIWKRVDGGGKEKDTNHAAYQLLRYKPNSCMTAYNFKQTLCSHRLLYGNAYAYIVRMGAVPVELLILSPMETYPVRVDGQLWYVTNVSKPNGGFEQRKLPAEDIIHWRGLGFDGLVGYDVISVAKESLGLSIALKKFGAVYFKQGGGPGVVLEHPAALSAEAAKKLAAEFKSLYQGLDGSHRVAVLREGMKANVMTATAKDAQMKEAREFSLIDIANVLGIPPHKVGHPARTSFNSLEQENKSFLSDSLNSHFVSFELELRDKLLSEAEKRADSHVVEFNRDAAISLDHKTKIESLVMQVNNGLATINQAMQILNRPSVGPMGDKLMMPLNIAPVGNGGLQQNSKLLNTHRAILVDALSRMHSRICVQAKRAANKPDSFIEWIEDKLQTHREVFERAVSPILNAVATVRGDENQTKELAGTYFDAVKESLLQAAEVQADDLSGSVARWCDASANMPEQLADRFIEMSIDNEGLKNGTKIHNQ